MKNLEAKFKKLRKGAICPTRAKKGDVGWDLYSPDYVIVNPFEFKVIPIGIAIQLPEGYYSEIWERSGLASKKGIKIGGGVIDNGFSGELGVIIYNFNTLPYLHSLFNPNPLTGHFGAEGKFEIKPGDKIAQLIIKEQIDVEWTEVDELSDTERGQNGFGSTGI